MSIPGDGLIDFHKLADRCADTLGSEGLARLAGSLGISTKSLLRLHVGSDGEAFSFPMQDAGGRVVGIRRRLPDGRKLAVKGGREGLFIPMDLPASGLLFIAEGPTDTAALLDLGFAVIGRPNCTGGVRFLVQFARGRNAVVVADADERGQRGAASLASTLRLYCSSVRAVTPPAPHKDARAWVRAGADRADVLSLIESTPVKQLSIEVTTI